MWITRLRRVRFCLGRLRIDWLNIGGRQNQNSPCSLPNFAKEFGNALGVLLYLLEVLSREVI